MMSCGMHSGVGLRPFCMSVFSKFSCGEVVSSRVQRDEARMRRNVFCCATALFKSCFFCFGMWETRLNRLKTKLRKQLAEAHGGSWGCAGQERGNRLDLRIRSAAGKLLHQLTGVLPSVRDVGAGPRNGGVI